MTDLHIDMEAACAAARRYAQLVYYHDNSAKNQYRAHPFWAWHQFARQFAVLPRGVAILSLISHSFAMETRRLVDSKRS